jgi:HEAT repeat protein
MNEEEKIGRWMNKPLPEDAQRRLEEAKELDGLGESAIPQLLELAKDKYYKVRQYAIHAISEIGGEPAVSALLKLIDGADSCSKGDVIMALGATKEPAAVPAIYAAMGNVYDWVKKNAVWALERMGDVAAKELLPILENGTNGQRINAAVAIGKTRGTIALPALLVALKDEGRFVGSNAAIALGQLGDERATPHLLAQMERKDSENIRNWCAHAIAEINDSSAIPRMVTLMHLASKKNATVDFAKELSIALMKMGLPPVSCIPELLEIIAMNCITVNAERERVSEYIKWALPHMGESAVPLLTSALFHPNRPIAVYAAEALSKMHKCTNVKKQYGEGSPATASLSEIALNRENPVEVRNEAIGILQKIGDERALPAILSLIEDPEKSIRRNAATAVCGFRADSAALSVLMEAALDTEAQVRLEAVTTLSRMPPRTLRDLKPLACAIRATKNAHEEGGDRSREMNSLRETYNRWFSQLSERAERRHHRVPPPPPRFRAPKKSGRNSTAAQSKMAVGGRRQ